MCFGTSNCRDMTGISSSFGSSFCAESLLWEPACHQAAWFGNRCHVLLLRVSPFYIQRVPSSSKMRCFKTTPEFRISGFF